MNGYKNVIDCGDRTAIVNGETFELGVRCTNCQSWIRGNYNFKFCPNCGEMVAHVSESPATASAFTPEIIAKLKQREVDALKAKLSTLEQSLRTKNKFLTEAGLCSVCGRKFSGPHCFPEDRLSGESRQ